MTGDWRPVFNMPSNGILKPPELLSPAGNARKLAAAYAYGADAAYIGIAPFSLRKPCEKEDMGMRIAKPPGKSLYGAINMLFREDDLDALKDSIPRLRELPYDAFIVSDLGAARLIRDAIPDARLHLSTQCSCLNSAAVREYEALGFERIILGREATLDDIRRIKDRSASMEIEVFVHGAMCFAISGRCLLSSALAGRSANRGECSQPCRWKYRLALEEESRPGRFMPLFEDGSFSSILSGRDLCMIDHMDDLMEAGVDSVKIEGRMKSEYYVAMVTRGYRKMIDALAHPEGDERRRLIKEAGEYAKELDNVSHREYTTGFFYGDERERFRPAEGEYVRKFTFLGSLERRISENVFAIETKNKIEIGKTIELVGPDVLSLPVPDFEILDENLRPKARANINEFSAIRFPADIASRIREGFLMRSRSS